MVVQADADTDHDRDTIDNEAEDDLLGAGKDDLDDQNDVRENTVQKQAILRGVDRQIQPICQKIQIFEKV